MQTESQLFLFLFADELRHMPKREEIEGLHFACRIPGCGCHILLFHYVIVITISFIGELEKNMYLIYLGCSIDNVKQLKCRRVLQAQCNFQSDLVIT
jgi:hypothetical protein